MGSTLTTLAPALTIYYSSDRIADLTYKDNPLYAMLKKKEDVGGESYVQTVLHGTTQAVNSAFTQAQTRAGATNPLLKRYTVTHIPLYSLAQIDGRALRRTDGTNSAMLDVAKTFMDDAIGGLTRRLATQVYRSGWGSVGNIGSISTNTITLAAIEDAANFEIGHQVVFSASEAANTLRNTGATTTLTVSGVNRDSGIITFLTNVSTVTGATAGDFIFFEGDRQDSATPTRQAITGLEGWIPQTTPAASENFFGVDRSVDTNRLAGSRWDATGVPAEEVVIEAAYRVSRYGGSITDIFCNPSFYRQLIKSMGARVQYVTSEVNERIGFRSVMVVGTNSDVRVTSDFNCPVNRMFGTNLEKWKLFSTGPAVRPLNEDGQEFLRQASADSYEVRFGFEGNMACSSPRDNINVKLS